MGCALGLVLLCGVVELGECIIGTMPGYGVERWRMWLMI